MMSLEKSLRQSEQTSFRVANIDAKNFLVCFGTEMNASDLHLNIKLLTRTDSVLLNELFQKAKKKKATVLETKEEISKNASLSTLEGSMFHDDIYINAGHDTGYDTTFIAFMKRHKLTRHSIIYSIGPALSFMKHHYL